jgi:hypothetical protein
MHPRRVNVEGFIVSGKFLSATATAVAVLCLLAVTGCEKASGKLEPERVVVQHLLVSFAGKVPGKNITRSQSEARTLAEGLFDRASKGEDFGALVKQYTDDQAPGTYTIVGRGQMPAAGEYGRDQMVPGFVDVAFGLAVGGIGLCRYDGVRSPFGYHIIKRMQ